jgi:hypothetical protein
LVDRVEGLELALDGRVPLAEMEALLGRAIEPRQVVVAEQLERVVDAFVQQGLVGLDAGDARQVAAQGRQIAQEMPAPREDLVGLFDAAIELAVQHAQL